MTAEDLRPMGHPSLGEAFHYRIVMRGEHVKEDTMRPLHRTLVASFACLFLARVVAGRHAPATEQRPWNERHDRCFASASQPGRIMAARPSDVLRYISCEVFRELAQRADAKRSALASTAGHEEVAACSAAGSTHPMRAARCSARLRRQR